MAGNDFKAFIFKELGDIRMEMAENARATKLRETDDTESTNSGTSSLLSHRSSTSDAENQRMFATPLAEQPSEIRALLEKAVALVAEGVWSRSTCQRYFAALRQYNEPDVLQPARLESLSFMQPQEMYTQLQPPPPQTLRACRLQGSYRCRFGFVRIRPCGSGLLAVVASVVWHIVSELRFGKPEPTASV